MKSFCIAFTLILASLIPDLARAQTAVQFHFKEVHIAQSYTGADGEALIIRGLLHSGKKISLRLKGIVTVPYGSTVKAECVKLSAIAAMDDRTALEIYYVAASPSVGANDAWQYKEATVSIPSTGGFSCLLANASKYDYSQLSIAWYDLP